MSRIEDLLREATRESGACIEPGSLPPLNLSRVRYGGRKRVLRAGRGPGGILVRRDFALPALAAVVLVVVVVLSLALAGVLRAHSGGGSGPATNGQGPGPSGVPRYYVTGSGPQSSASPISAEVVDSRTGAVVTVVKPPAGFVSFVAFGNGSSGDRTFAVAAVPKPIVGSSTASMMQPLTFFVLRFDPATRQATLQAAPPLKGHFVNAGGVSGLAVSPDGSRLAVSGITLEPGAAMDEDFWVSVISLFPGSSWRTWQSAFPNNSPETSPFIWATQPQYSSPGITALSWTPGSRVLALGIPEEAVLLDTTRPAGDLLKAGRTVVFPLRLAVSRAKGNAFQCDSPAVLSGDGTALVCFGQLEEGVYPNLGAPISVQQAGANAIGRFSAATGKLLSLTVLPGSYKGPRDGGPGLGGVAWSNAAGDILVTSQTSGPPYVVVGNKAYPSKKKPRTFMIVVSHGVAKAIPEPAWAVSSPDFFPDYRGVGW